MHPNCFLHMNSTRITLLIGAFLAIAETTLGLDLPSTKLTVQVRDEDNNPVPAASLKISGNSAGRRDSGSDKKKSSDPRGLAEVELKSTGEIWVTAEKPGYYRSQGVAYNYRSIPDELNKAFRRGWWEPWNPTADVILKRVINPIPMYARTINRGLPSTSKRVCYDLVEGDFTAPEGRGKVADLIFTPALEDRGSDNYDFKLSVTFSNPKDGIARFAVLPPLKGSVLRSPHQAPEAEYLSEWVVWRAQRPQVAESSNYDPENHAYFIRVRTVLDERGRIVSTNYGKIYGDFMNVTYYLNPTANDRNVEFDPTRNLSRKIPDSEQVTSP